MAQSSAQNKPPFFFYLILIAMLFAFLAIVATITEFILIQRVKKGGNNILECELKIAPEYNSPFIYRFTPNTTANIRGVPSNFNNFGFRRPDDVNQDPGDKFRILSYGDSVTYGVGVTDDEHYPQILERLLNKKSPGKFEVNNVGGGASPSLQSFYIKKHLKEFKPKLITMEIELTNDVADEAWILYGGYDENGLPKSIKRSRYFISLDGQQMSTIFNYGYFWQRTRLYTILTRKIGYGLTTFFNPAIFSDESDTLYYNFGFDRFYLTEERLDNAFDRMFNTIKSVQKLANKHDAELLLILVPARTTFYDSKHTTGNQRLFDKAIARSKELNIPHVSIQDALRKNGGTDLYIDFCHLTPKGYDAAAAEIYAHLIKNQKELLQ